MNREVIRIEQEGNKPVEKPVEFTHALYGDIGWQETLVTPDDYRFTKVVYLGFDKILDADKFAAYRNDGHINIFKGHLNSGKY